MKKISIAIILGLVCVSGTVMAQGLIDPLNQGDMQSPIQNVEDGKNIFITVVQWVYTIFFIVAVLFILIAAYNFIIGGADEDKIKLAKNQIKYAVIAIVIALIASSLSLVVKNFLESPGGGGGATTPTPTGLPITLQDTTVAQNVLS